MIMTENTLNKNKSGRQDLSKYFPVLIALIVLIVFIKTFFYYIIYFDDQMNMYVQSAGGSFWNAVGEAFKTNYLANHYYRPLTVVSFIINSIINGPNPMIYHETNIFIHMAASIVVYLILVKLNFSKIISLAASLLFALTPLQVNALGWISGRADLLAGLFIACSFLFFTGINDKNKFLRLLLILIMTVCAVLSKEVSLVLPFFLLFYLVLYPNTLPEFKHRLVLIILSAFVLAAYSLLRISIAGSVHVDKFSLHTMTTNLPLFAEMVFKFFIPLGVKALPDYSAVLTAAGSVLLLILITLPFRFKSINRKRYFTGMAWFFIFSLPGMFFNTMMTNGFFYWDCRSYASSIGLTIVAAEIFGLLKNYVPVKAFTYSAIAYLLLMAFGSFYYIRLYENGEVYWKSVNKDYPERYSPHVQLYYYYAFVGEDKKARAEILQAFGMEPGNVNNCILLAGSYYLDSKYDESLKVLTEGLKHSTDPGELSLAPHFIRTCGKLEASEALDNFISGYQSYKKALGKLREILLSEADDLLKKGDSKANIFLTSRLQKIDSVIEKQTALKTN